MINYLLAISRVTCTFAQTRFIDNNDRKKTLFNFMTWASGKSGTLPHLLKYNIHFRIHNSNLWFSSLSIIRRSSSISKSTYGKNLTFERQQFKIYAPGAKFSSASLSIQRWICNAHLSIEYFVERLVNKHTFFEYMCE